MEKEKKSLTFKNFKMMYISWTVSEVLPFIYSFHSWIFRVNKSDTCQYPVTNSLTFGLKAFV